MTTPPSAAAGDGTNDHLVQSSDPEHPANLIPSLCAKFWTLGWVTGTGGGASIRDEYALPQSRRTTPANTPQVTSSTSPPRGSKKNS